MIILQKTAHAHTLMTLLAYVGEFPVKSVLLLGSERVWKALIQKMGQSQEVKLLETGEIMHCQLVTVSGKGRTKTVRMHKSALPVLEKMDSQAYRYYMDHFQEHHFSGGPAHIDRDHRIAEAVAMCWKASVDIAPAVMHKLREPDVQKIQVSDPVLYLSRELKDYWGGEMHKTMYTRIVGLLHCPGNCYGIYNTRDALMKWNGIGEEKIRHYLSYALDLDTPDGKLRSAILFGDDYDVALRSLQASTVQARFDKVYQHIHFVPMNEMGIKMLRTLTVPDWWEQQIEMLYGAENRVTGYQSFEYDAVVDGMYCFSHLDGDLCRLMRLRGALSSRLDLKVEITCYPEQEPFIKEYMDRFRGRNRITIRTIRIDQVCRYLFDE